MKIVNITLEGTPIQGEHMPRAIAILSRSHEDGNIEAQVLLPGGAKQRICFQAEDTTEGALQRHTAACELALMLEDSEHNAKGYVSVVEIMIHNS